MGRVFKPLVFWAEGYGEHAKMLKLQLDTGADRTIIPKAPPGGVLMPTDKTINGKKVDLVEIITFIPNTACTAVIQAAVPKRKGSLPSVIGADFFQEKRAVLDYRGHLIGCPRGRGHRKGFAGAERTGVLREEKPKKKKKREKKMTP